MTEPLADPTPVDPLPAGPTPDEPTRASASVPAARLDFAWLDGLRGAAAVAVVLFHAFLFTGLDGQAAAELPVIGWIVGYGYLGVPAFIVLSGYVLMLPLTRTPGLEFRGGVSRFLRRRAWRILPPYYAALALSLALIALVPLLREDTGTAWDSKIPVTPGGIVSHLFLVHDFSAEWVSQANGPLWSVAVEWHIYFLMPFVLVPLWRRVSPFVFIPVILLLSAAATIVHFADWAHPWLIGLFALGMLAAQLTTRPTIGPWPARALAAVAIGLPVVLLVGSAALQSRVWIAEILAGIAIAAALAVLGRRSLAGHSLGPVRVFQSRPMRYLGLISYSIYLVHSPILALGNILLLPLQVTTLARWAIMMLVVVPVALGAGWLFFRLVERHFLNSHQQSASRELGAAATAEGEEPGASARGNVTIVGLHYAPEPSGNAPYTTGLAEGLAEDGWPVHVITGYPHYPAWRIDPGYRGLRMSEELGGVPVRRIRPYVPASPSGLRRLLLEVSFGIGASFARWHRPAVVVLVSPALFSTAIALVRARLTRGRPEVIVWVQDIYSLGVSETGAMGARGARVMLAIESWVLRHADSVVVIHDRFKRHIVRSLAVDEQRITVVRNWTHLRPADVDAAAYRERFGWGDEVVVLHAGNMGAKQALENVVEAARVADAEQLSLRFVLLGDGNQRVMLEHLAAGIGRIEFLTPLGDADFQGAMAAADILLVNEKAGVAEMAVPSKLTSYFAARRPVIVATDEGSITADEIAAASAGLRVDAGDPRALALAAVELGRDAGRSLAYAEGGAAFRERVLSREAGIAGFASAITRLLLTIGH